tara:strand:- start:4968 stop:5480 length:513 start_codon:yes stop_codon:yes gene_type:complete
MSVINTINNIKNQISGVDNSNKTSEPNNELVENFGDILDSTIKDTSLTSAVSPTNIQDGFKEIFNELGIGIASSLAAAFTENGSVSADKTAESDTKNGELAADDSMPTKANTLDNEPVVGEKDPTDINNILESIALLTANKSISTEARNALTSLQDVLLKNEQTEKQTKS